MRFLVDINCSLTVAAWLRSQGYDAVHLRERGLHSLSDEAVFSRAMEERRIVLTFDLDFGDIVAASGYAPVGVILFRLHDMTPEHVIERLRTVIQTAREALNGAVVLVQETRLRIRRLPIGS